MDSTQLRRLLLTAALPAAGLVAAVGVAAAVDGPRPAVPVVGTADISGPCDEAEHAGDPECAGATVPVTTGGTTVTTVDVEDHTTSTTSVTAPSSTTTSPSSTPTTSPSMPTSTPTTATSVPGDVSGPCDEAEHADDPRCTGVVDDDDNSGPGSGGDDDDDDDSGPGSDNSGPGGGGDNSGPGGGDD